MLEKLKERMAAVAKAKEDLIQSASEQMKKLVVSDEQREARFDICKSCDYYFSPTTNCKLCGCFMSAKTYLPESECPLKKWIKISEIK
jgi:hypothetical protein